MTLVATSGWIDFLRGRDLPHVRTLERLIRADEDLALCGLVLTEVLQGIRDDLDYERTRARLSALLLLRMDEPVFLEAAEIYRTLRKRGVTIRRTNGCVIAAVGRWQRCFGVWSVRGARRFGPWAYGWIHPTHPR